MKINMGGTIVVALLLGLVLHVNDAGWLATLVWPIILGIQAATWFYFGRRMGYMEGLRR